MIQFEKETDCIRSIGQKLINNYQSNIKVIGGINGPYDDPETSVRNLSHLIIICAMEILKYNKTDYKPLLRKMGDELIGLKDKNGLFIMREKATKDTCNGVIGHAWSNEALIYLYKVFQDNKYLTIAAEMSKKHSFNTKIGLWGRPTDGIIDNTMNHQLWYAATLIELNDIIKDQQFEKQINRFMEKLAVNFSVNKAGRIQHNSVLHANFKDTCKQRIKYILYTLNEKKCKPSMAYKEAGYHVFNLMALARIYSVNHSFQFFKSEKFVRALKYVETPDFFRGLEDDRADLDISLNTSKIKSSEKRINIYGFTYNVPGLELPYISYCFPSFIHLETVSQCIEKQIEYTYDSEIGMLGNGCHDKQTINYRVYEFYRFLEIMQ